MPGSPTSSGSCWHRTTRRCPWPSTWAELPRRPRPATFRFVGIESWATEPAYVDLLAGDIEAALADPELPANAHVVFTAHSLPRRILESADPYPAEVAATAKLVAGRRRAPRRPMGDRLAIGRTHPRTLAGTGPPRQDRRAWPHHAEVEAVLVCPCGFVSDHLEVLYDLDVEARQRAEAQGLILRRTAVVNDDSGVMAALARRVIAAATGS